MVLKSILSIFSSSAKGSSIKQVAPVVVETKSTNDFSEQEIKLHPEKFNREIIKEMYGNDPWICNLALNTWEFATRQIEVKSYPVDITIPCIEYCNAKCIQCAFWRTDKKKAYTQADIENYRPILKYAVNVGFNPAGETLLHPDISGMFDKLRSMIDKRCAIYMTSNGILLDKHFDTVLTKTTSCTVSFNAATPETYAKVMGVSSDFFGKVVNNVRELKRRRDIENPKVLVMGSFLVMNQNIHELPAFIKLADDMKLDTVYIRTPYNAYEKHAQRALVNPDYKSIDAKNNPNFRKYIEDTKAAMKEVKYVKVDLNFANWEKPLFIKGEENYTVETLDYIDVKTKGERISGSQPSPEPDFISAGCRYPYSILMDCRISNIMPICCHMNTLPDFEYVGFDWNVEFNKMWNTPAIKELRRCHKEGPLPEACKICTQLDNVKDGKYFSN